MIPVRSDWLVDDHPRQPLTVDVIFGRWEWRLVEAEGLRHQSPIMEGLNHDGGNKKRKKLRLF